MQALQTEDAVTQRKSQTDNAQKQEPLFTLMHSLLPPPPPPAPSPWNRFRLQSGTAVNVAQSQHIKSSVSPKPWM